MAKLIEATYGDALFELAVEESRVDSLYDEPGLSLKHLMIILSLADCSINPEVEKGEKEELIN